MIFSLLPYYIVTFGANLFTIGLLAAISPVSELLSAPIQRFAANSLGLKAVLFLSQIGKIVSCLILGFAQTVGMLFFARR